MPLFDIHAYFGSSPLFGGVDTQQDTLAAMERYGLDGVAPNFVARAALRSRRRQSAASRST